jgi:hypothetical protein
MDKEYQVYRWLLQIEKVKKGTHIQTLKIYGTDLTKTLKDVHVSEYHWNKTETIKHVNSYVSQTWTATPHNKY